MDLPFYPNDQLSQRLIFKGQHTSFTQAGVSMGRPWEFQSLLFAL
jgi:hypothetical protein